MPVRIKHMNVLNYRSLAHLSIETDSINVLFGPNGANQALTRRRMEERFWASSIRSSFSTP